MGNKSKNKVGSKENSNTKPSTKTLHVDLSVLDTDPTMFAHHFRLVTVSGICHLKAYEFNVDEMNMLIQGTKKGSLKPARVKTIVLSPEALQALKKMFTEMEITESNESN